MRTNPRPPGQAWALAPAAPDHLPDCALVTWLLDLDGVVWLTGNPIPGAVDAIARLRRAGERVAFFTNNSGPTMAEHLGHLAAAGIEVAAADLLSSAHAAASHPACRVQGRGRRWCRGSRRRSSSEGVQRGAIVGPSRRRGRGPDDRVQL